MQTVSLAQYYTLLLLQPSKGKAALATLQQLVIGLRPTNRRLLNAATDNLQVLLTVLQQNPTLLQHFTQAVATVIIHADITNILTDSGLITGATFAQQVRQVISHKLIPPYYEPEDANGILTKLFTKKWDYQWVNLIPNKLLAQLITMVNTTVIALPNDVQTELTNAAKIVSYRIASLGLEGEIFKRANKSEHIINAFTQQNTYLLNLVLATPPTTHEALYNLRTSLLQCQQNLRQLESNSITTGTSINQTFLLRRLSQHVNRLKFIISFFDVNKPLHAISISYFLKDAVAYIKTKNSLRKLSSTTLNLLAYRIVDHTKDTGELYITSTRTQYWKIFSAAAGGGLIVSFLVIIKFYLGRLQLAVFWEGIAYSLNYAAGFIAIQLCGFTLATKQPAMTASTLANSLQGTTGVNFKQMAITISRVCRTQFISIVGNVSIVMPCIALWFYIIDSITTKALISTAEVSKLLSSNHILLSNSILYAAIAGVFLFISGLVSGYVENSMVYAKIPQRLSQHGLLKKLATPTALPRIINFIQFRGGAIFGNLTLGILLGMASFVGKILGLPFDIRHITFAAGNIAMALHATTGIVVGYIVMLFVSIFVIGLVNLLASFSLAFYVAIKARNLSLSDYPQLSKTVIKHFLKTPLEFFVAPRGGVSKFQ